MQQISGEVNVATAVTASTFAIRVSGHFKPRRFCSHPTRSGWQGGFAGMVGSGKQHRSIGPLSETAMVKWNIGRHTEPLVSLATSLSSSFGSIVSSLLWSGHKMSGRFPAHDRRREAKQLVSVVLGLFESRRGQTGAAGLKQFPCDVQALFPEREHGSRFGAYDFDQLRGTA